MYDEDQMPKASGSELMLSVDYMYLHLQHKEKFDMVEVGSWGVTLPPSFAGDWKVYIEMWITREGRVDHECSLTPATIYEA